MAYKRNSRAEPYNHASDLFDGDLHLRSPGWTPREDWVAVSPTELIYMGSLAVEKGERHALVLMLSAPDKDD